MERYGRGKGKRKILGSHQKCWIWGRNLVGETLSAGRWPILDLHLDEALEPSQLGPAIEAAEARGIPCAVQSASRLEALCHSREHQGYLARMAEYPYEPLEGVLGAATGAGEPPLVALLDGIQDPYNLGAIVRSAEVFGLHGVVIGVRAQVGVTSMVARASAGAVNRIRLARVESLDEAAAAIARAGICLIGTSEKAETSLAACDLRNGACLVIGNEGRGMRPEILARCACAAAIPQHGRIGSLNAAVAAGIVFYEARRQRAG